MAGIVTIVELTSYSRKIKELLPEHLSDELSYYLAQNPESREVIQNTGGIRKLRWMQKGKGKRGGIRVIYYFYNEDHPLFLLTAYPKGKKEDLSPQEKKEFKKLTKILIENY